MGLDPAAVVLGADEFRECHRNRLRHWALAQQRNVVGDNDGIEAVIGHAAHVHVVARCKHELGGSVDVYTEIALLDEECLFIQPCVCDRRIQIDRQLLRGLRMGEGADRGNRVQRCGLGRKGKRRPSHQTDRQCSRADSHQSNSFRDTRRAVARAIGNINPAFKFGRTRRVALMVLKCKRNFPLSSDA